MSPEPWKWPLLPHEHLKSESLSSLIPHPRWTERSRRVRLPPASEWRCTERRWCRDLPHLHLRTLQPWLIWFQADGAVPDNLCIPPLNVAVQTAEGSAGGRGRRRVRGFGWAAGRGTEDGWFSGRHGWRGPKPSGPEQKHRPASINLINTFLKNLGSSVLLGKHWGIIKTNKSLIYEY